MFRKPNYAVLIVVVIVALVLTNLPQRWSLGFKALIGGLFLPLFGLVGSAQALAADTSSALTPRRALLEQIERLTEENRQLRAESAVFSGLRKENEQLRQMLQWRPAAPAKLRAATVVGRDTANWWRTVEIDVGGRDGVVPNLSVMTPEGVVGRIGEVGFDRSRVILVGDAGCRIAALVDDTRDQGVIEPATSTPDRSIVHLTYLPSTDRIRPGQRVTSSGLGGIFPRGLTVGRVIDTRVVGHGLYMEARVKLAVNMDRLEYVWVVLP